MWRNEKFCAFFVFIMCFRIVPLFRPILLQLSLKKGFFKDALICFWSYPMLWNSDDHIFVELRVEILRGLEKVELMNLYDPSWRDVKFRLSKCYHTRNYLEKQVSVRSSSVSIWLWLCIWMECFCRSSSVMIEVFSCSILRATHATPYNGGEQQRHQSM